MKDKTTAAVLAFLLGWCGAHRFYLGQSGPGCLYLFFFFTFPFTWVIGILEGVLYLTMSQEAFDLRFNPQYLHRQVSVTVTVDAAGNRVERVVTHTTGATIDAPVGQPVARPATPPPARVDRPDAWRTQRPRSPEERERFVLQAAAEYDGILTAADLALHTQLSMRDAQEALESLRKQEACDLDIDPATGVSQYIFPDFHRGPRQADATEERLDDQLDAN